MLDENTSPKIRATFVASYCAPERIGISALGAAAKIRAVLVGLSGNGLQVVLINSAHQGRHYRGTNVSQLRVGGKSFVEIEPPTFSVRAIGKFLQCCYAPLLAYRINSRREPTVLWLYNPYLFETIYLCISKLCNPRLIIILELEDLPMSRRRYGTGLLKNALDFLSLKIALRLVDGVTQIQKNMLTNVALPHLKLWYWPVLLSHFHAKIKHTKKPPEIIGYFGGLYPEKGVDDLIVLIRRSPKNLVWSISGAGSLATELLNLSKEYPESCHFHGVLSEEKFQEIYKDVDVLVNLHRPIQSLGSGVFPYKLLEAVAHGKLILSAPMDGCPTEVESAIHWLSGDLINAGIDALNRIEEIYVHSTEARLHAQNWVQSNYTAKNAVAQVLYDLRVIE